jgi:Holliday junction resolvase-like predicted endonuclease
LNDWYNRHRLGAIAEARASAWLIEQGWRVFHCISGPGPADLVISDEDGRMKMVNVKRRPYKGKNNAVIARATISKRQRELGVEILYVLHDNTVRWEADLYDTR